MEEPKQDRWWLRPRQRELWEQAEFWVYLKVNHPFGEMRRKEEENDLDLSSWAAVRLKLALLRAKRLWMEARIWTHSLLVRCPLDFLVETSNRQRGWSAWKTPSRVIYLQMYLKPSMDEISKEVNVQIRRPETVPALTILSPPPRPPIRISVFTSKASSLLYTRPRISRTK